MNTQSQTRDEYAPEYTSSENDTPVLSYSMDDTGNAERFADMFKTKLRYNFKEKAWLYWNGERWITDTQNLVEQLQDDLLASMCGETDTVAQVYGQYSEMSKMFVRHVKASRSVKNRKAMLELAKHHMPISPELLDSYPMFLNTPSGIVDLKTGETRPHLPGFFLTKITKAKLSDSFYCPLWEKFLNDIFAGDSDLIRYVQKAVGYTLSGSTSEQCLFFLYGTGQNGKSTFLDIIREIMGGYALNIQPETIMIKSTPNSISSDIARLKGARFVTSVEPNEGARLNEGFIKQLTGDDTVTARKLYCEEFEFKPEFKLWIATNHKPLLKGTDTGLWRRIHMIPFTVQIPDDKVDKNLKSKLLKELPEILRWCLEGCLLWQEDGLNMPKAVRDGVNDYRREMDVLSEFIEDRCELSGNADAKTLYACSLCVLLRLVRREQRGYHVGNTLRP